MSATSLEVVTLCFPNPEWDSSTTTSHRINSTLSFSFLSSFTPRTLSTTAANPGSGVTGLLYTPDLPPAAAHCRHASDPYVPTNATRQRNLPDTDYDLIAIAPWLSPDCTLKYLESAQDDPIRGFLFFLPDNNTAQPPDVTANMWSLGDGGSWKREYRFPVYVIPGASGNTLMHASAEYSQNMTDVPYGHILTENYDPRDYVRLYADINTAGGTTVPSLWVFLLVVLGILLTIIGLTSGCMHWLQRRRRQQLRWRVASGEVDLEALGIKRLTVPQEILDQMPLCTYGAGKPLLPTTLARADPVEDKLGEAENSRSSSPLRTSRPTPALIRSSSYHPTPLQQPTCAICLEDFVAANASSGTQGTIVRELPCHHIFHPECVDSFLRDSSSLCPMCKKTALPQGYCPRVVTNAMVRRERMVRRIRPTASPVEENEAEQEDFVGGLEGWRRRNTTTRSSSGLANIRNGRRVTSAPLPSQSQQMTEMSPTSPSPALLRSNTTTATASLTPPTASNPNRREWARQRAIAMLGRQRAPIDPDAEDARATPRWRKALRGMFPALGR